MKTVNILLVLLLLNVSVTESKMTASGSFFIRVNPTNYKRIEKPRLNMRYLGRFQWNYLLTNKKESKLNKKFREKVQMQKKERAFL